LCGGAGKFKDATGISVQELLNDLQTAKKMRAANIADKAAL
jgi:hypothetical protein